MKTLEGKIISNRMRGTVTVLINRQYRHPLYGKILTKRRKIHAKDELGTQVGQWVKMVEIRPLAKTVSFKVTEILSPKIEAKTEKPVAKKREVKAK